MKNIGRYRYFIAVLLFVAGAINYIDRSALGIVAPIIDKEFGLSPSQLGIIYSAFFVGYAIFAFVGGHLADRYGPRRVFSVAMGSWSILCGLTATVTGFGSLLIFRGLFGFAEGPMNSVMNKTVGNWFSRSETSTILGFAFSGQTVGAAIAGPVVGLLALNFSWRIAFVFVASVGLVWIIAWRLLMTDKPADNHRVSAIELEFIEQNREALRAEIDGGETKSLRAYLIRPSTLALAMGLFSTSYTLFVFISWLPSYFVNELHLDVAEMSFMTVIPWAFGGIGYFFGGIFSDIFFRKMKSKLMARKLPAVLLLALSGAMLVGVSVVHTIMLAVLLIALAVMFLTSATQACFAMMHELIPANRLGGVTGFIHLISNLAGILSPAMMGFVVQYFHGYSGGFVAGAVVDLIGVLAMAIFIRPEKHRETLSDALPDELPPVTE
ncbi:MFS transporter [Paraburkholderia sp. Ac-20342]|uniref:MFS transporter n=1 Tax=Paraburkholderia sp. Ac-20342 TaxID=2703889 RepID=UPI001982531B|nr:MFS transporter [Paraburkholderia sp. Ac-20342]MBN3849334.1 MFS transporter [Paraburkholderia sp. Ac-20342]